MTSERLDSSTPSPPERPVSGLILSGLAELALGALTGWPYALAVTDPERARRVGIRSMIVPLCAQRFPCAQRIHWVHWVPCQGQRNLRAGPRQLALRRPA